MMAERGIIVDYSTLQVKVPLNLPKPLSTAPTSALVAPLTVLLATPDKGPVAVLVDFSSLCFIRTLKKNFKPHNSDITQIIYFFINSLSMLLLVLTLRGLLFDLDLSAKYRSFI
jgi:hypothetical protein